MTTIDDNGLLTIDDAQGEVRAYRVGLPDPGAALWAAELTRLDSGGVYRIELVAPGRWRCSCLAWAYRKRGSGPFCKHLSAVVPIWLLLKSLGLHATYANR